MMTEISLSRDGMPEDAFNDNLDMAACECSLSPLIVAHDGAVAPPSLPHAESDVAGMIEPVQFEPSSSRSTARTKRHGYPRITAGWSVTLPCLRWNACRATLRAARLPGVSLHS